MTNQIIRKLKALKPRLILNLMDLQKKEGQLSAQKPVPKNTNVK